MRRAALLALLVACAGAEPPSPEAHLGFRPGADSLLADWGEIHGYLGRLAATSPLVRLDTIGRSTLGKPLLLVTLASARNQRRLDALRQGQALLADPRRMDTATADSLIRSQPAVVLINNNIHSTEIASSQMQLELAWLLATDPDWRRFLDSVVVLIVPSANPDGLDTVVHWYRQHRGTPFENGPLPWLYHPYAGHDNNRDWFMLTQTETQALTRVLYREWFPEVVWDVHQMGTRGARLFVPPFSDPVNPNLDPMLVQAINLAGTAMAAAVLDAGKTGVAHQQRFDLWWHGGFRTVPARHNMVGILSEAASARLASPATVSTDSLRPPTPGVNYPAPWPGGPWHLSDIVEYELLAARGLLQLVATHRTEFVQRFVTLGRRAVTAGSTEPPAAFVIPPAQRDRGAAALLANLLLATGIEIQRATAPFAAGGMTYPAGTLIIPLAQPFRAHVKDLLEPQRYPDRREYPGGPPVPPYDVAGWTLGLQMGVAVATIDTMVAAAREPVDTVVPLPGRVFGAGPQLVLGNRANAESGAIAAALAAGARVWLAAQPLVIAGDTLAAGTVIVDSAPAALERAILARAERAGFDVWRAAGLTPNGPVYRRLPRVALYRPWTASMDEGWTRWVLERFDIPHQTVTDSVLRRGDLRRDFDVLLLPDLSRRSLEEGHPEEAVPPGFSGGLGPAGVRAVTEFVAAGGTLVALDGSSDFAVSALKLPVRNALENQGSETQGSRFSAPGSIFGVVFAPGALWLRSGLPDSVAAFVDGPRAFAVAGPARVVARYAASPLLSGYVQAPERVAGQPAVVEVSVGRGRAVLIGFRPQHRGQTHATFKLLFNAVLFGTAP